jgi:hypothetical protein
LGGLDLPHVGLQPLLPPLGGFRKRKVHLPQNSILAHRNKKFEIMRKIRRKSNIGVQQTSHAHEIRKSQN